MPEKEHDAELDALNKKMAEQAKQMVALGKTYDAENSAERSLGSRGCGLPAAIVAVIIAVVGGVVLAKQLTSNDEKCEGGLRNHNGLALIACTKSDSVSNESVNTETASSESVNSEGSGGTGGGTAAIPPPDAASLPKGAILFQGQSGSNIGPIAQDGLSRFMPLTGTGISTDANSVAITWDKGAGTVVSFGSNLHTGTNKGRYGFNLFRNVPATPPTTTPSGQAESPYRAGCAIEVGQTSCKSDIEGAPVVNGDKVTIIIGEAGTGVGDYSADWWFVFQPD